MGDNGGGNGIGPFAISTGTMMSGFGSSSDEDEDEDQDNEEDVTNEVSYPLFRTSSSPRSLGRGRGRLLHADMDGGYGGLEDLSEVADLMDETDDYGGDELYDNDDDRYYEEDESPFSNVLHVRRRRVVPDPPQNVYEMEDVEMEDVSHVQQAEDGPEVDHMEHAQATQREAEQGEDEAPANPDDGASKASSAAGDLQQDSGLDRPGNEHHPAEDQPAS